MSDRVDELTRKVRRELAMLAQPQKGDPSPKMLLRETIRLVDALARETDKLFTDLDAANARADDACDSCASMQERLTDALDGRELWRKRAIHLAFAAGDASVPTHFATVEAVRESAALHLASAMYCLDNGTLFLYPDNALAAAREAVRDA